MKLIDYRDVARQVIKRAVALDPRFPNPSKPAEKAELVDAWESVLDGKVWPDEAVKAVAVHYGRSNAFPIMPGDVVAYCQAQPAWSSAEHAREFLRKWCQHPYSGAIGMQAGIEEPLFAIPESVVRDDHKKYLIHRLNAWVSENEQMLIDNILEKKLNPW